MEQRRIDRINELARKAKSAGLTPEEQAEREILRSEYLAAFRSSLERQLDHTYVVDGQGNRAKLRRKQ